MGVREVSEVLDVKPAEYFVQVTKREKRACKTCEEQGVAMAPLPVRIIAKSLVSDQIPRQDYDEDEYLLKPAGLRDTHSKGKVILMSASAKRIP
jgi:zinc-finger binding domain of transposase IS66